MISLSRDKSSRGRLSLVLGWSWLLIFVVGVSVWFGWKFKNSVRFDEDLGLNLIVLGQKRVGLLSLRDEAGVSSFLALPEDLLIQVAGTEGEYLVGNLWELGSLEGEEDRVVTESISRSLGVSFVSFLRVSRDELVSPEGVAGEVINPISKSNLWWWDRLRLRAILRERLASGSLLFLELPQGLTETRMEADGLKRKVLADEVVVDDWASKQWTVDGVLSERKTVAVFNNSDESGKARQLARQLEAAGMAVVVVGSGGGQIEGCRYWMMEKDKNLTTKMLEKNFFCLGVTEPMGEVGGEYGADIAVWVGQNGDF